MKHFLIKYERTITPIEAWHKQITEFIAALDTDPELKGRVSYRALKHANGADYYHLASTADPEAGQLLQSKDFFKRYTQLTSDAAGQPVHAISLEVIGETSFKA